MHSKSRSVWLVGGLILAASSPAYAQNSGAAAQSGQTGASADGNQNVEEIVVTALKREQRLIDVPQSVSVLSNTALEQFHAERLADYLTRVPGANFVETQAGVTRLVLRGINTGGVGATVATYVDETPYGSATALANGGILTPDIDPFDLQRVEVMRGPQGTLYGANSLGGVVKYVTVAPSTDGFHGAAEANLEDVAHGDTGWSGRAAVNVPLGEIAAVRGSGYYRKDPGYIDDPVLGSDINDGKTYGGRASLLVRPVSALTLRGTVFLQDLKSNGSNNVDVDPGTLRPTLGRLQQSRLVREPNDIKYRIYNLTGDYDFGPVTLLSSTSWGTLDQNQVQDASGVYGPLLSPVFGFPLGAEVLQDMNQRRFTQELRLSSSQRGTVEWTLGGFYTHEDNLLSQTLNSLDGTTGALIPVLSPLAIVTLNSSYKEIAGFANATVHFSPKFDVTLGGRYSHNKQSAVQGSSGLIVPQDSFGANSSDDVFTYSLAPAFKPNDHTTIYARIARGYRPGGPNAVSPLAPAEVPRQFGADTTTNYELGVKSEVLPGTLMVELTAFYIDWNDVQLIANVENFGVNTNGGKARSQGIEFSATLTPAPGLSLSASGAYVDAELTRDAPDLVGGKKGDPLPYNPHFSTALSADYSHPLSDRLNGTFGISWRYTGSRKADFDAALGQHKLDSFGLLDAHAGITFDRFRIDAFVRNLTDSRGIVNLGGAGTARDGAVAAAVVRPRSIGLALGVRY